MKNNKIYALIQIQNQSYYKLILTGTSVHPMSENNNSNSQLSAIAISVNRNGTFGSDEVKQMEYIDPQNQPPIHATTNIGQIELQADIEQDQMTDNQSALAATILGSMIDKLIRQQAREAFVSEQIHVLQTIEQVNVVQPPQQPAVTQSSNVLESQISSFYANQQNNHLGGENSGDNDNSFMRNVPEKEESAFSKEATIQHHRGTKPCNYVIVSAASTKTQQLPQPDSNQAVAEDEIEDSMSDEAGMQPYTQTQSLQLFSKQPQLYQKMSISQNLIQTDGIQKQQQHSRGASGLRVQTANSTFFKQKKSKQLMSQFDLLPEAQDNSALNISDQISVNIKYDSFREEASKFKINSLSNQGPIGTLAEPKKPKLHHQMMNLDRISVSERKALGVFGNDRLDHGRNDDLRIQTNILTDISQLNQHGTDILLNQRSPRGSQFELLKEDAYKQVADVKCNNCGIYLKFEDVEHHSMKCQQLRNQSKSTIQIYFHKKQNAENDLSDINENIQKIQEAIFARLGQIDQQYEEVLSLSKFHSDSRELSMVMKLSSYKHDTAREQNQIQDITISESDYSSKFKKVKTPNEDTPGPFSSFRNCAKSPVSVAQSPSVAYTEKAILENLNYFIDQFTNLHAVCNKALEVDESSEELQLVLNVLSQDLQQIEESASQEQFSDALFFPTRDSSVLPPNMTQENLDQVIVEQRHRQLINFAKRIMFCIMHKLNALQALERINDCILEEKRRDLASRQDGLSGGQAQQVAGNQDPRSQDNQLWRYQSVHSSNSNRPPSNQSQNAKLSARVRPKVRRAQNSDRGEGLDSFKISNSDIDRDFENILNDSKLLLTNQSGRHRQADRGTLGENYPRRPVSDKDLLQDCFFSIPMTPKQKKKGWSNPRIVSTAVVAIEINDRVDKGVVEINISQPKRQLPILENYVMKSKGDSKATNGQPEGQGALQSEYLDHLLQLNPPEQNKEWSIDSRSPRSALERDCTYQLFQLQNLNLKEQTEAIAKADAAQKGSRRTMMHDVQEADLLSPVAAYQEKSFAEARTQQQAKMTPKKLKFQRTKADHVTKLDKRGPSPEEAPARLSARETAAAPPQTSMEQAAIGQQPPSSSLRHKSVQDYKNTFKQYLQKKREGETVHQGRGSALTREGQGSGAKTKDSGEKRKSPGRNQSDQKPSKPGNERRRAEPDLKSQILQDFGIAPKKNENIKQSAKRSSFLLQSRQQDASGSGQKKQSPNDGKGQEKAPLHQSRKSTRAIQGFQSAGQRTETGPAEEESKLKSRTNKATTFQTIKSSIPAKKLKNQEGKQAGTLKDQKNVEQGDSEKSPRLPHGKLAGLGAMSPLVTKEGVPSSIRPNQESSTAHKPREHPTSGNVSSVSPLPRRSRKINIADYGYSDQQLRQARNSVDRIMGGGKSMKAFDVEAWRARQEQREQEQSQEETVQLTCQKKTVEEKMEVPEKPAEKQEESKIEEEKQSELERSLLWDGLITLNQSSQLPTIQTENQLETIEMKNSDAKSERKTKEQDPNEGPKQEPRKTNQSNDSQRSSVRSRKNLFAKKGRASMSSVDRSMSKGGNESLNEIEREINLLQSESQSRRSHRQFLPKTTHSQQRSRSRKSETRVPAIAGFEQALLRPDQSSQKPNIKTAKNESLLEPPAERSASTSSKGSDRARRSRKINIEEYGYGEEQLRRAQRSVSQLSKGSAKGNDNKME